MAATCLLDGWEIFDRRAVAPLVTGHRGLCPDVGARNCCRVCPAQGPARERFALQMPFTPISISTLPPQPTRLIDREAELSLVRDLVSQDVRLLTLTGPGGVGKTRLAIAAAEQVQARFPDGVWFVDLTPLADSALVVPTIARVLGVREQPGQDPLEALTEFLRDRDGLGGAGQPGAPAGRCPRPGRLAWRRARALRSWSRVASRCDCAGNRWSWCRPCRCRVSTGELVRHHSGAMPTVAAVRCARSGRRRRFRAERAQCRRRRRAEPAIWRGCRWRWNWPRPGPGSWSRRRCWRGWSGSCRCCAGPRDLPARHRTCTPPSPGATPAPPGAAGALPSPGGLRRGLHAGGSRGCCREAEP